MAHELLLRRLAAASEVATSWAASRRTLSAACNSRRIVMARLSLIRGAISRYWHLTCRALKAAGLRINAGKAEWHMIGARSAVPPYIGVAICLRETRHVQPPTTWTLKIYSPFVAQGLARGHSRPFGAEPRAPSSSAWPDSMKFWACALVANVMSPLPTTPPSRSSATEYLPPMEGQVVQPMRFFIRGVCAAAGQHASPNLAANQLLMSKVEECLEVA